MDTTVRTAWHRRVPVVHVSGEFDMHAVDALRHELVLLSAGVSPEVVVDLTGASFIDSTGLGVLVGARKKIAERGGTLVLVIDRDSMMRTFRISSLVRLFTIHGTLDDALTAVRPVPHLTALER